MLILRIRQAETALADGRLDEAFDVAQAADLRSHRRGQELATRLVQALVARGRGHLEAQRWPQALADMEKAGRLGGNLREVAQLRDDVAEAINARHRSEQRKGEAVAAARQQLRDGQLTLAEGALTELGHQSGRAAGLLREAAARRATAEPALAQAREALDRGDWDGAIRMALEARRLHASNAQAAEMVARVSQAVMREIRAALQQGRIDRAGDLLERLEPLAGRTIDLEECGRIIEQCNAAAACARDGRPQEAEHVLRRLAVLVPGCEWVERAIEDARQAAGAIERLRTGPLGMAQQQWPVAGGERRVNGSNRDEVEATIPMGAPLDGFHAEGENIPERFMMHIDGVGSFLVLREKRVTVGPAASAASPDVPLLSDSGLPAVTIERADEDYFLRAERAVEVNERAVTRKLLADGDRVALAPRCRLRFALPNGASTTAVLHLSGTRLPRTDARRVILLDRELVVGPASTAHVRTDEVNDTVVFCVRDGRLFARTAEPVLVDGDIMDRSGGIPLGAHVRIGPLSLVVTEA